MNSSILISCIGDSITFGLKASSPQKSYPAVLETLLGGGFTVSNFGHNGATASSGYTFDGHGVPYTATEEYRAGMVTPAHYAIIMLGMNDGNPTHTVTAQTDGYLTGPSANGYRADYERLIRGYQSLPSHPRVLLAQTTLMSRKADGHWSEGYITRFRANLTAIRAANESLAASLCVPLIDTLHGMDEPLYYSDGAHMTDAGYHALAEKVYAALSKELRV